MTGRHDPHDLDKPVTELNAGAPNVGNAEEQTVRLRSWLEQVVGYGARQQVRRNALQHLNQEITITRKQGSLTLEESLTELVKQGLVDRKDALTRAAHPDELDRLLG